MPMSIKELPPANPDGTKLSRLDRELQIRELWPTIHERRLMAVRPYGLSKVDAFSMTPISILHWLLDAMVKGDEIEGPLADVMPGQEIDATVLLQLVQSNQSVPPMEEEGITMTKNAVPPPPAMSNIPPPPGSPGSNIPPPPGSQFTPPASAGWAPPAPPQVASEEPAPTKKRGRPKGSSNKKTSKKVAAPVEAAPTLLPEDVEAIVSVAVEPLVASIGELETEIRTLQEELGKDEGNIATALGVLLLGMYQQTGDPTDLAAVFKQLNINP